MILVNGLVDWPSTSLGAYELLCESERGRGIVNETACDVMREVFPECWRQHQACLVTDDPILCNGATRYCQKWQPFYDESGRDLYDIRHKCAESSCADPVQGNITTYLDRRGVLSALGMPSDFVFADPNAVVGAKYWSAGYDEGYSFYRSMLTDIASILDATQARNGPSIRLLVLNGNDASSAIHQGTSWLTTNCDGAARRNIARRNGQTFQRISRARGSGKVRGTGGWCSWGLTRPGMRYRAFNVRLAIGSS